MDLPMGSVWGCTHGLYVCSVPTGFVCGFTQGLCVGMYAWALCVGCTHGLCVGGALFNGPLPIKLPDPEWHSLYVSL